MAGLGRTGWRIPMKHLFLLRHAKSSWDIPSGSDRDRPLNRRGEAAAEQMAEHLARSGAALDTVLCSPALRTRQTLEAVLRYVPVSSPVIEEGLYLAGWRDLTARLALLSDGIGTVLLIGHNPGLEDLALRLSDGGGDAAIATRLREKYPTGALAGLNLAIDSWSGLVPGCGRLVSFVRPADLGGPLIGD